MAKPTIIYVNDEDKIVLTKQELTKIIDDSYQDGYKDGSRDMYTPYYTITTKKVPIDTTGIDWWNAYKITC